MSAKKRKKRSAGTLSISLIVLAFLIIMSVQIVKLRERVADQEERIEELNEQYAKETERQQDIVQLEESMEDPQFVEDQAKSKLGLVYDNEIIFKEIGD